MRGSRKFYAWIQEVLSEGVQLSNFFLVDEWREDQNSTIRGSLSACYRNPILMAFPWRADDGKILNAGLVAL